MSWPMFNFSFNFLVRIEFHTLKMFSMLQKFKKNHNMQIKIIRWIWNNLKSRRFNRFHCGTIEVRSHIVIVKQSWVEFGLTRFSFFKVFLLSLNIHIEFFFFSKYSMCTITSEPQITVNMTFSADSWTLNFFGHDQVLWQNSIHCLLFLGA